MSESYIHINVQILSFEIGFMFGCSDSVITLKYCISYKS